MDCEKFDQHVMDALYDELDELTHAAMKRHMDSCGRCASAFAGLRAARDAGPLPLEEPSEELEARILEAVEVAQKKTPFRRKALRALAWAGSHAMRPQLAMAALFVLVIGSSLLLLRPKTGVAPVRVTEWGQPASDHQEPPSVPAPVALAAPADEGDGRRQALAEAKAVEPPRAVVEATKEKSARGAADAEDGASAALREAQALQRRSGCAAAVGKLDEVGAQYPGTPAAHTAMWEAARCYEAAGQTERARELLLALRSAKGYGDRAEQMLAGLEANVARSKTQNAAPIATSPAAAAPARRAAPSAKPAAAPRAADEQGPAQAAPPDAVMGR
ncbi:zf-HC2 domain-containing protein [Sorangium sp. So ce1078]|uniref:zf-HC2 domain-containing protein n=1 Tax=Sorangium sp. So ce1078 TaxID=3133329 RepID=UPI003F5E6BFC